METRKRLVLPLMMYRETTKGGIRKRHNVVPTWNHLYTMGKGKVSLDKWAKIHKAKIEILTLNWMEENEWEMVFDRKVYVDFYVFFPDYKIRDCHNLDKLYLDAFEDAEIFNNDANALVRYQDFDFDEDSPRIEVEFIIAGPTGRKNSKSKNKE